MKPTSAVIRATIQRILYRFSRATVVGIVATLTDLGSLTLMIEVFHLREVVANWPSLFLGVAVQFIGAKYVVFRANQGPWLRHVTGFAVAEVGTYVLNGIAFHLLVTLVAVPYILARIIGTLVVFLGFSYPVWHWVFKDGVRKEKEADERKLRRAARRAARPRR